MIADQVTGNVHDNSSTYAQQQTLAACIEFDLQCNGMETFESVPLERGGMEGRREREREGGLTSNKATPWCAEISCSFSYYTEYVYVAQV